MISPEEIQEFLEGADPEEHIVSVEYDYATDAVYKIKEIPLLNTMPSKPKMINKNKHITPFIVFDLSPVKIRAKIKKNSKM